MPSSVLPMIGCEKAPPAGPADCCSPRALLNPDERQHVLDARTKHADGIRRMMGPVNPLRTPAESLFRQHAPVEANGQAGGSGGPIMCTGNGRPNPNPPPPPPPPRP